MGCFDYACAVTGVSIASGEPVLQVVALDPHLASVYELRNALRHRQHIPIQDVLVRFGTYDQYGWIEEEDSGNLHPLDVPNFMVRREVADEIASPSVADLSDPLAVLEAVLTFMFLCRITPWASLVGMQHFDEAERQAHRWRIQLIEQTLAAKEQASLA